MRQASRFNTPQVGRSAHVLVVDDNPLQIQAQKLQLEKEGFRVSTACSSAEALRAMRVDKPDLILSDVMMPDTDGFQLCRAVRQAPALRDIPVVLVSGLYGDPLDVRHAAHCGANMFITRAAGPAAMVNIVRRVLARPRLHVEPEEGSALIAEHGSRLIKQLERLAKTDAVTGLLSRAAFEICVETAVASAVRRGGAVAVLVIGLGNFRDITDTLGPEGGDAVLREAAGRLREAIRHGDVVCARLSAAQFGALLPKLDGPRHLDRAAQSLLGLLGRPANFDGVPLDLQPTLGSALCPEDAISGSELLRRAGVALRWARRRQTTCARYHPGHDPFDLDRLTLISELRPAIVDEQLELWYQPKIDLRSGLIDSAEALVRWRHPTRGVVAPAEFVPAAESTGLIRLVTDWALQAGIRQARRWMEQGRTMNVSVNVTQCDLRQEWFGTRVMRALESQELPPDRLTLEITESAVMQDSARVIKTLKFLRAKGLKISLDDFGTGQASLSHLHQLPLDEIKLDGSFVRDLGDRRGRSIVRATAMLAREFGLASVAEGVETQRAQAQLAEFGYDRIQGYHLSKPLTVPEFDAWLRGRQIFPGAPQVAPVSTVSE